VTGRYVAERSIGVFGSAFNPPHLAHRILLAEATWQLGLDRVIVVPTGDPYHKDLESDPGAEVRFRLAEAAFAGLPGVEVSAVEVAREGPSYTCETLEEIAEPLGKNEIHLLMGADAARGFAGWKSPERILELARIGIVGRPGTGRGEVESVFASLGAADRIGFVDMPQVEISSSMIRRRIAAKQPFGHLVPAGVAQMIDNEDTYGT
jgi:nicotinate-nucleotide adenylyltransferase